MKMVNIVNAQPALEKIASVDLPLKLLYSLKKLMEKLEREMRFFNEERDKLIMKYGEQEDDGAYRIPAENVVNFQREANELGDIDVEWDVPPIVLPLLDGLELSYKELKTLEGFIELRGDEG
jgi:hypothetical protein